MKNNVHIQHNKVRYLSVSSLSISHTFKTTYKYNSYNQLISTTNPDQEGETRFWYDFYGRIVASQNPNQAEVNTFSYTLYDEIGRPYEVGQLGPVLTPPSDNILKRNDKGQAFRIWVVSTSNGQRKEVTRTRYDQTLHPSIDVKFATGKQENLRMRVASVSYYNMISNTIIERFQWGAYNTAIHYSYDIHGNVKEVIQDVPIDSLPTNNISTQYEYELISGNMKKVSYQKEKIDQITHEYKYDNLNRLTDVLSSIDDIHYHREASYTYYDYGPLARKEIGSQRVQGQDFTYTINGWLKGMNSNTLDKTKDPGKDGTSYPSGTFASRNQRVAKDVVGFSLGYYSGDYSPIGGNPAEAAYSETNFGNGSSNLYNGNIRHMVTAIEGLDIQGYAYKYDQLQRIKEMQVYRASDLQSTFSWANSTPTDDYKTTFSYDRNGNLSTLNRNGFGSELDMDRFEYKYFNTANNASGTSENYLSNRLNYVIDNGTDYEGYDDIKKGQLEANYTYNKIGELTGDAQENMILHWRTGDHKLARIERTDENSPNITFSYNPFGQRIAKIVEQRENGVLTGEKETSFYSYDASGQVMAIYELDQNSAYKLKERYLYGAERLGVNNTEVTIFENNTLTEFIHKETNVVHVDERGQKRYELVGHTNSVLAVISDRKLYNELDGNYEPVMISWSDYYAFGMTQSGRNGSATSELYRYQFQSMETDREMSGNGNSYTTEFRQYDPRLGRWKSLDPLIADYPEMSPYVAFNNNPVYFIDPEGLEGGPAKQKLELPSDQFSNGKGGVKYGESFGEKMGNWIRLHVSALFNETVREILNQAKQNDTQITHVKFDINAPPLKYGGVFDHSNEDEGVVFWKYSTGGRDFETSPPPSDNQIEDIKQSPFKEKKEKITHAKDKYQNKKNRSNKARWGFSFAVEDKNHKMHWISMAIGRHWETHSMIFTKHKESRNFTHRSITPLFGIRWKTKLGTYNWIYIGKAVSLTNGRPSNWVWDLSKKKATIPNSRRKSRKRK